MPNTTDYALTPSLYYKDPQRHCQHLTQHGPRNEAAWAALIDRLDKFFVHHARNWGVPEEDIQDIMQDTLGIFIDKIDAGEFTCTGFSPISYVGNICRNLHLTYQKRMKKHQPLFADLNQYIGEHDERQSHVKSDQDTTLEDECKRWAITRALNDQPVEHQTLLLDFYVEETKLKELAKRYSYTEKFVRVKKTRVLKPFREAYFNYFKTCMSNG